MLAVILTILKILGIILLSLIGFLLLILLLILFVPIQYRGKAEYFDSLKATGQITWLFGIIKLQAEVIGSKKKIVLYLFGIRVKDDFLDTPKEKKPEPKPAEKKPTKKKKKKEKGPSKFQKIKSKFANEDTIAQIGIILKEVGHIIKHILPSKFEGRFKYGFDDPALTGYLLAIVAAIIPPNKEKLLIETDFTQKCFEMDVKFSDRIFIIYLLICILRVLLNKHFRSLFFSGQNSAAAKEVTDV